MIHTWNIPSVLLGVATGIGVFVLLGVRAGPVQEPSLLVFFFSGAIAISAMILPGISGSFFLLMIGMYGSLIAAVNERYLGKLLIFGLGAVLSLSLSARLLNWILRNYRDSVLALQAHPEFNKDFSLKLLHARKSSIEPKTYLESTNELETLEHDSELITPNIINFLEQKC